MRDLEDISCLEDLQAQKERLKIESEVCLVALSYSTKQLGSNTKQFALGKIAIPLGVISAIGVGLKMKKSFTTDENEKESGSVNYPKMLFSILFPFIKDFFLNKSNK